MVCFKDSELGKRALILGSWGRESTLFGVHEKSEDLKKRFKGVIDGQTYDAKFIFSMLGYNFQSTELSGAFGLEQLKRLKEFANRRKKNFSNIVQFLKLYENFLILPKQDKRVNTNWLSVPLTIKKNAPFTRLEITKFLEEHNIQTRPIFTGTIIKQPGFKNIKCKKRKSGYPITNHVMKNGFLIGCHHGMTTQHLAYLKQTLKDFFEQL
jgi:CDP-6-deoxy-D-xylo-4-hexulose-3-dehydrase